MQNLNENNIEEKLNLLFIKFDYINQLIVEGLLSQNLKSQILKLFLSNPQQLTQGFIDKTIENCLDFYTSKDQKQSVQFVNPIEVENQLSEKYIQKIQEEELLKRLELLKKQSSIDNQIECQLCFEQLFKINSKNLPWGLIGCNHCFHRNCLKDFLSEQINNKIFPLKRICPMGNCGSEISQDDLKEVMENNLYKKYQEFTINNYVDLHSQEISWCPTANCKYAFMYDQDNNNFVCPVCFKNYCLFCKVEFHNGMTCAEYKVNASFDENDQKFIQFCKGSKFKQCPNCKYWVAKNEGCDHANIFFQIYFIIMQQMTCRCKFEFCYVCGGPYQNCLCQDNY